MPHLDVRWRACGSEIADAVLAAPPRLGAVRLVAVDGPSGSGKTCFARALAAELADRGVRVAVVPTDHFATWDQPVEWWPDLVKWVLAPLSRSERARYQRIEWRDSLPQLGAMVDVDVPDVLVLEGVSSARAAIAPFLSHAVWVEHPDTAERLARAVRRDGEVCRAPLLHWQRFEQGWFAVDQTRERADSVLSDCEE
ncbi:hypothetical protein GCM10012275_55480 [Longimycelium tulufanense]|uniref:(d)CMP kinase n=1 Tax=Longimycelium tulufanense TaxID=907463 RepID=A0A8J3FZ68_9PSEU|nr:hypothetical protein [Longimycelium tulufanense]GGM77699.1 hypothetical protein GCM10012275_55480 [Longimycelium tulufanense]